MNPSSRCCVAALVLAATALALPAAASAGTVTKRYAVEITGIHQVDWTYQSGATRDECADWSAGAGSQTTGFSTRRPVRYTATRTTGPRPKGFPKVLWAPAREERAKITVAREVSDWNDHLAPGRCSPCELEGGCSGPAADRPQPPAPATDCRRRSLPGQTLSTWFDTGHGPGVDGDPLVGALGPVLQVQLIAAVGDAYDRCYPDLHEDLQLRTPDALPVTVTGAGRVLKLRPGRTITLKGSREKSVRIIGGVRDVKTSCPKQLGGEGYGECAVTDVSIEIRRLR